jgi:mRNA interferase MazF
MKRGDVVTVAAQGDYGKPRPAVVIQTDRLNDIHGTFLVCPVTSHRLDAPLIWIEVDATPENGLRHRSQIMADRIVTIRRGKIGNKIGAIELPTMERLTRTLAMLIGVEG